MNHPNTDKGLRPALLVLLAVSLTVILIPVAWHRIRQHGTPPPDATVETATTQPLESVAPPADVVAPIVAAPVPAVAPIAPVAPPSPLEDKWGLQVTGVTLLRAGTAVHVGYKVIAPEKAGLLADGNTAAYLIDETSGTQIPMNTPQSDVAMSPQSRARSAMLLARLPGAFPPRLNHLVAGKTNAILFPNPGGVIKSGTKVSVMVGDIRADNLTAN